MAVVDLIIPTFNEDCVYPCVRSILANTPAGQINKIFVVNNGDADNLKKMREFNNPMIEVLDQEKNLGWQGGLLAGLAVSKTPFVLFMNDDTFVPPSSKDWLELMGSHLNRGPIAGVGPCSNNTPGFQDMGVFPTSQILKVPFLTGFCLLLDRSALDSVGGIDLSVKWGDDIDLSFRLRKAGFELIADRRVFVFHHGGRTGRKVYPTYYDSDKMIEQMCENLSERFGNDMVRKDYKAPKYEVFA